MTKEEAAVALAEAIVDNRSIRDAIEQTVNWAHVKVLLDRYESAALAEKYSASSHVP